VVVGGGCGPKAGTDRACLGAVPSVT